MDNKTIADGVWPTMVTPFTSEDKVDYPKLEKIIEWYIENGVQGLFSVCQSSEMFYLSLEERAEIARFVINAVGGRVQVIASGHISDEIEEQIYELQTMADTGVQAVVLVSNRLAGKDETDEVWKRNAEIIIRNVPGTLGIYECPYPYKRLMAPELLKWCASTGKFMFLKDTCCNTNEIKGKIEAVKGTNLKIFNANAATLLESLKEGVKGYSGVMANFHPDLYVWLCSNWLQKPETSVTIQNIIGFASVIEYQWYPVNAKFHMQLEGIDIDTFCRVKSDKDLTYSKMMEIRQLREIVNEYRNMLFFRQNEVYYEKNN